MRRRTIVIATVAVLLVVPLLSLGSGATAAPAQPRAGWVTLMTEDFEGTFPHSPWHIGRTGDPYLWGQRPCNPHRGAYSMWAGGGGAQGAQVPCGGKYTANYVTTLSYGPLDLTGCTNVRVNFHHWTDLTNGDELGVGFSNDGGVSWNVVPIYGDPIQACGGWCQQTFDKDRYSIPLCGKTKVYLLFRFRSDPSDTVDYGTFVDDVSLEAYYEGTPPTTTTPTRRWSSSLPLILR